MPVPSPIPPHGRRDFLRRALAAASAGPIALGGMASGMVADPSWQRDADDFLAGYVKGYLPLYTESSRASWAASTDVSEAHTAGQIARGQALNEFVGAPRVIETVRKLLEHGKDLDDLTARQLEKVRLRAAEAPGTIPEVVRARTKAEARQSATQDGFAYTLERPGRPAEHPSANDLDRYLIASRDLSERRAVWESSKAIGGPLRDGLLRLRDLRNQVARAVGFDSFFGLQVADYGMTVDRMIATCDGILDDVRPLYENLHAWARRALAARYGAPEPAGPIPAHWLTNRWGQNWPGLVEGVDADGPFKGKPREFITEQAEAFYVSLGFPKLPRTFYERSDLYPADPKTGRKKNSHASPWQSEWIEISVYIRRHASAWRNKSTPRGVVHEPVQGSLESPRGNGFMTVALRAA